MNNPQTQISGPDAIARMRLLRQSSHAPFKMIFITLDTRTGLSGGVRKVEAAKLRAAFKEETFQLGGDNYLAYTDMENDEPRMCFKKLIREVAFPPNYEWLKVNWVI